MATQAAADEPAMDSEDKMTNLISEERLRNTLAWATAHLDSLSGAEVIVGAINEVLRRRATRDGRDGNWLDEDGSCKVCDGEIPYGHTDACDIWKLEKEIKELKAKASAVEPRDDLVHGERAEAIGLLRLAWGVCHNENRPALAAEIEGFINRLAENRGEKHE